eukprot:TRINITY_DN5064_c0_g1_i1.p1 TRINITY_DN5064_c0_g1~~TRINITY_DN5064_c0_g1_i1.p1  ORF type:complete len:288 (-),score=32.79 TRINITY_DN5064_c0_g1_i1:109-858(-)
MGKEKKVLGLLKKKKPQNINFRDQDGLTLLNCAAFHNRQLILKDLVGLGADVNLPNHQGNSPLYHAVSNNNEAMVTLLLQSGADTGLSSGTSTPLLLATASGNERLVELLIEHGADVNLQNKQGTSPIHVVANQGNERLVRLFIDHGAHVDSRNENCQTPVGEAKSQGHEQIVKILAQHFCKTHGIDLTQTSVPSLSDEKICKVCWERDADIVLLWCGHVAICCYCAIFLRSCPICCQPIQKVQRIFLS